MRRLRTSGGEEFPYCYQATAVNTANESRGPLLLMAAKQDHKVDQVLVHSAYKRYRGSSAVTELIDYEDRGHSLTVDRGTSKLIDDSLGWLNNQNLH